MIVNTIYKLCYREISRSAAAWWSFVDFKIVKNEKKEKTKKEEKNQLEKFGQKKGCGINSLMYFIHALRNMLLLTMVIIGIEFI